MGYNSYRGYGMSEEELIREAQEKIDAFQKSKKVVEAERPTEPKFINGFCPIHKEQKCDFTEVFGKVFFTCPLCEKEETIKEQEQKAIQETSANNGLYESMNVPANYQECSFLNYKMSNKFHELAIQALFEIKKGLVVICGKNGVGKTHLAIALLRERKVGYYEKMFFMSSYLREDRKNEYLEKLLKTPILVIDEFGRTNTSEFEKNWLGSVLDTRTANNLITVIISNYPMREMIDNSKLSEQNKYRGEYLEGFIGNDLASRLQGALKIRISGEDYRAKNKKEVVGV